MRWFRAKIPSADQQEFSEGSARKSSFFSLRPSSLTSAGFCSQIIEVFLKKRKPQQLFSSLLYSYLPACSSPRPKIRNNPSFPSFWGFHLRRCSRLACQGKFHLSEVSRRLSVLSLPRGFSGRGRQRGTSERRRRWELIAENVVSTPVPLISHRGGYKSSGYRLEIPTGSTKNDVGERK